MKSEILNKIEELNKVSSSITTNQLVKELKNFGDPHQIVNDLIDNEIIERIVDEKIDLCSFNTLKLNRILKLKNLSN